MIWKKGFAYERFDLTEPVFEGGLEKIVSVIHWTSARAISTVRAMR